MAKQTKTRESQYNDILQRWHDTNILKCDVLGFCLSGKLYYQIPLRDIIRTFTRVYLRHNRRPGYYGNA